MAEVTTPAKAAPEATPAVFGFEAMLKLLLDYFRWLGITQDTFKGDVGEVIAERPFPRPPEEREERDIYIQIQNKTKHLNYLRTNSHEQVSLHKEGL